MRCLIGIDDTDNLESRGTGHRARRLGALLEEKRLAVAEGITRHQLLVDPRIPYTSHNSSACIAVSTPAGSMADLIEQCRSYLIQESAEGSDAGLCMASWAAANVAVQEFGRRAKTEVIERKVAESVAAEAGIYLEGLTGDGGGVIGALAAAGLHAWGREGRFLWLNGLRELAGVYRVTALKAACPIDEVRTVDGLLIDGDTTVDVGPWPRPILQMGRSVLLVEETGENEVGCWRVIPKEIIKKY